ncbi:hypothetical protein [Aquimarina sp. AU119]|uniref:hypothetical protein n=1 Tax=Aquimarina sp. AU119 TaxID=2108528 RepID=UPI00135C6061|nr:hypothetical protein [Aquimarina sp. AU119]
MDDNLKDLFSYLNQSLPSDIDYRELSNLCLTLFCTTGILPEKFQSLELNKENLAIIFSKIAKEKKLPTYPSLASLYGASFHKSHDKGHWLEVMASILKLKNEPDIKEAEKLLILS